MEAMCAMRVFILSSSYTRTSGGFGASQFFVITNFAMWAIGGFYPKTTAGLVNCFVAGVPFFWNTLAGDALYAGVFFGGFALAKKLVPALRLAGEETAPV